MRAISVVVMCSLLAGVAFGETTITINGKTIRASGNNKHSITVKNGTVIVDGRAMRSCMTSVRSAQGRQIRTIEGLGTPEKPHPVQQAFIEEAVPQCGYCISGWVMTSVALLEENPRRSDSEIRQSLSSLKCRCGTQMSILRAVNRAAKATA